MRDVLIAYQEGMPPGSPGGGSIGVFGIDVGISGMAAAKAIAGLSSVGSTIGGDSIGGFPLSLASSAAISLRNRFRSPIDHPSG